MVWSVQFSLLGLSQGATTVPELGPPSEQGLNAGWRVWLCEPGLMGEDEGRHISLTLYKYYPLLLTLPDCNTHSSNTHIPSPPSQTHLIHTSPPPHTRTHLKKVCCSTAFFHTHLADGGSPHDRFISATVDVLFMVSVGRYLIRNFLLLYEILTMWGQGKRKTSVWSR